MAAVVVRVAIPETPATKAIVATICSYEVAAITTGAFPTVSAISKRWPVVGAVLVAALAIHFASRDQLPTPTP